MKSRTWLFQFVVGPLGKAIMHELANEKTAKGHHGNTAQEDASREPAKAGTGKTLDLSKRKRYINYTQKKGSA